MSEEKKIQVINLIDADQLKKDLTFSMADLSNAMMTQASLATHYGILAAKASRQLDQLELSLEIAEGKVYRALREEALKKARDEYEEAVAAGDTKAKLDTKAITEASLAKSVSIHPTVVAIKKAIIEAKQIEAGCKTAVEAFRQRRDMLVQSGLISREEMKGDLSLAMRREAENAAALATKRSQENIRNALERR